MLGLNLIYKLVHFNQIHICRFYASFMYYSFFSISTSMYFTFFINLLMQLISLVLMQNRVWSLFSVLLKVKAFLVTNLTFYNVERQYLDIPAACGRQPAGRKSVRRGCRLSKLHYCKRGGVILPFMPRSGHWDIFLNVAFNCTNFVTIQK